MMNYWKNRSLKSPHNKGFTLLEMIVSIAIFTVVALVSVGALLKIVDANKKAQSLKTAINNLNFSLDSISREMRVGTNYHCDSGYPLLNGADSISKIANTCVSPTSDWSIYFYSSKPKFKPNGDFDCYLIYAYRFKNNLIEKAQKNECKDSISDNTFSPITAGDVNFTTHTAKVVVGANKQSYVQLHFVGYTGIKEANRSYFDVQTMISQRLPD